MENLGYKVCAECNALKYGETFSEITRCTNCNKYTTAIITYINPSELRKGPNKLEVLK